MRKIRFSLILVFSGVVLAQSSVKGLPKDAINLKPLERQAVVFLNDSLESEEPIIKMHAAEAIAASGYIGLMPKVTKLLNDPVEPVRFAAVLAIGDTNYIAASYSLKQHKYDEAGSVRAAVSYSLYKLDVETDFSEIVNGIKSDDETYKANAAFVAGKTGRAEFIPLMHEILRDANASDKAKIQAIESLGRLKDEGVYQKAWGLLISKRADDKVMGIKTLEQLGTYEASKAIKTMINDDVVEVQMAAAAALAKLGDPVGEEMLREYFSVTCKDLDVQTLMRANIHAIIGLGYTHGKDLETYLSKMLKSNQPAFKLYAAQSILLKAKTARNNI